MGINTYHLNQLIHQNDVLFVSKELIKKLGLKEAVVLHELAEQWNYNHREPFIFTTKEVESMLQLSRKQFSKIINKLKDLGYIDFFEKDMPRKRYFKVLYHE